MTDYLPLTRKFRPRNFDEVVGQETTARTLKNALSAGKIHAAYLFTGPRGIGKTTLARILAKALNCQKGSGPNPCLDCDSCREIARSSSLDVLEMDAASNTGVENVREAIIETVGLIPHRDPYKIFIIDEAHMLSNAAFNALLKTLEEPPPRVTFILATTEAAKIPQTIASRCQRFHFKPLSVEILTRHLEDLAKKESIAAEPRALALLASAAEGAARDAVSLLDQCRSALGEKPLTESSVRDLLGLAPEEALRGISQALLERDRTALALWISRTEEEGLDPAQVAKDLRSFLYDLHRELNKMGAPPAGEAETFKKNLNDSTLSFLLRRLNSILEEIRSSDSPKIAFEVGLLGCIETPIDLAHWVKRLEALEGRLSQEDRNSSSQSHIPPSTQEYPSDAADEDESLSSENEEKSSTHQEMIAPKAPTPSETATGAWARALDAIQSEKLALATVLKKAEAAEGPKNAWRLIFSHSFDLSQAKKNFSFIQEALTKAAGTPVSIALEEKSQVPLSAPTPGPAESPLLKAQQILGGKLLRAPR